ncbi:MAG: hypothetical protein A2X56_10620 [Nitrospirae bacterium GWC2_57_13]|jgi:hypothetical protein|nr:MAG: hypothetical protein A2072_01860 [Nitrospirae bacterium GWC1_57_7]OGW26826.1 MAG: hypothetical protein A2X56_10620 [Nitrospirae bacterium GWC2_57_13]OGW42152.1 MAG: hypothetical protein A2X57_06275 [Nitrospirae bacterium GWD2_57_8]HAR45902.1 hypothetical protein [Nitrospiraceae bacterium]HAS53106.1 hypothetical protein [Nitrospiraceae bacterium]
MAQSTTKKKSSARLIISGLASIALFTALFSNQELVSNLFTRGGLYALLPIATALVFSYVHGSFTGDFWTALGVEASKKKVEVK